MKPIALLTRTIDLPEEIGSVRKLSFTAPSFRSKLQIHQNCSRRSWYYQPGRHLGMAFRLIKDMIFIARQKPRRKLFTRKESWSSPESLGCSLGL